jgi:hypothetical protein
MLRCVNDGVTTIKPGYRTIGNMVVIWSDELSFTLFLDQGEFMFGEHPRKPIVRNAWFEKSNTGEVL